MMKTKLASIISIITLVLIIPFLSSAQEHSSDESDLAKQTQNPVSSLISVPFQNNFNFGVGPDDDLQ